MGAIALVLLAWALEKKTGPVWQGCYIAIFRCVKAAYRRVFCTFLLVKRAVAHDSGFSVARPGAALAAVAIGRLQLAGVPWLSAYLANSKLVLTDPINSITAANPKRFQMINLRRCCGPRSRTASEARICWQSP